MKLKEGYVLREIAGTWVILPLRGVDLSGMIKLNESGVLLWRGLEQGADENALVSALISEYDVGGAQAKEDVQSFLRLLHQLGCLDK